MSEENVEIVRRMFDSFAGDGVEGLMPFFTEDADLYSFPEWVEDPEYHGHDGIRKLLGVFTADFDEFVIETPELRDLDDRVLALYKQTARIKGSGAPFHQLTGALCWDFRDGKIGKLRFFLNWEAALEAVGLAE